MKTLIEDRTGLNEAIGGHELCAWQPARGVVWVQTRDPQHARRMAKRGDGRLVARGVAGGYLKTFEFRGSLAWAAGVMKRYLTGETTPNEGLGRAICPRTSRAVRAGRGQPTGVPAYCEA
jgi:hypothetical protein